MFIPLKMVSIGIDPSPYIYIYHWLNSHYCWFYHHLKHQTTGSRSTKLWMIMSSSCATLSSTNTLLRLAHWIESHRTWSTLHISIRNFKRFVNIYTYIYMYWTDEKLCRCCMSLFKLLFRNCLVVLNIRFFAMPQLGGCFKSPVFQST
jgi:hypothetical protein